MDRHRILDDGQAKLILDQMSTDIIDINMLDNRRPIE